MSFTSIKNKYKDNNQGGYGWFEIIMTDLSKAFNWSQVKNSAPSSNNKKYSYFINSTACLIFESKQIGSTNSVINVSISLRGVVYSLFSVSLDSTYVTWHYTSNTNGLAIQLSANKSSYIDYSHYSIYMAKIGSNWAFCYDNNGVLNIYSYAGRSNESALKTYILSDRKAILIPVTDTTNAQVFNNLYIMRYSPIQYGLMEVEGKGIYLCGQTLCLKDGDK